MLLREDEKALEGVPEFRGAGSGVDTQSVRSIESLDLELRSVMGAAASDWNERLSHSPSRGGNFGEWTEERRDAISGYSSNGIRAFLQVAPCLAPVRVLGGAYLG